MTNPNNPDYLKSTLSDLLKELPEQTEVLDALERDFPGKVYIYGGACRVASNWPLYTVLKRNSDYPNPLLGMVKDLDIVIDDTESLKAPTSLAERMRYVRPLNLAPSLALVKSVFGGVGMDVNHVRVLKHLLPPVVRSNPNNVTVSTEFGPSMDIWEISKSAFYQAVRSMDDLLNQTDFNINQVAVNYSKLNQAGPEGVLYGKDYCLPNPGNQLELTSVENRDKAKILKKIGKLLRETRMRVGYSVIDFLENYYE